MLRINYEITRVEYIDVVWSNRLPVNRHIDGYIDTANNSTIDWMSIKTLTQNSQYTDFNVEHDNITCQ